MKRAILRRTMGLTIAIAIVAGGAGGALAYWSGGGGGTATTTLADPQPLFSEPGTPTAQLYPGGEAGVAIIAVNPNPFFVQVGSLVLDTDDGPPFGVDTAHGACDVAALGFTAQDNAGAGWRIPPRVGSADGTLAINLPTAISMSADASNACQGATFTVRLKGQP